jgi:hypothetical protein
MNPNKLIETKDKGTRKTESFENTFGIYSIFTKNQKTDQL